jgi:hypothetical protein
MFRPSGKYVVGLCLLAQMCSHTAAQDVAVFLPFLPEDSNTIAVLRVRDLVNSPRGQKEGWAEKHETEFLQGAITIPPWVEVLVRSSYARPGVPGGDWTAVVLPLPATYQMTDLAKREGTEVQEIAEHSAVLASRHSGYFVELQKAEEGKTPILGGMSPATRQDISRWITESHRSGAGLRLSEYLTSAAGDDSAQIVLALDMHEMLDPVQVRYRVDGTTALKDKAEAKAKLRIDLQTLKGVQFKVRVGETATAEMRLDFGRQIGDEGEFLKPLVIELLGDAGAELEEFADAQLRVSGSSATLSMPLSDESLRRVLSLVTAPPPGGGSGRAAPSATPPEPAQEPSAPNLTASRRYFQAVNRNIDDLQKAYGRAQSYARTAHWHENFAKRIEHLPTAGVDPALLEYGRTISSQLRALGASLRGTAVQVNALDKSVVYNVDVTPTYQSGADWWWGGARTAWGPYTYGQPVNVNVTSNLADVRAKQAEIVGGSAPQREQIWQLINDDRAATERAMVGKYGAEFQQR